jgi:hypothetical protein
MDLAQIAKPTIRLSFQKNPSRMSERIRFLITNFAIERTKARRRYWVGTPLATYLWASPKFASTFFRAARRA